MYSVAMPLACKDVHTVASVDIAVQLLQSSYNNDKGAAYQILADTVPQANREGHEATNGTALLRIR